MADVQWMVKPIGDRRIVGLRMHERRTSGAKVAPHLGEIRSAATPVETTNSQVNAGK